jgi:hypothetical protein
VAAFVLAADESAGAAAPIERDLLVTAELHHVASI